MAYRCIPTKVHGALDYLAALTLIFAPMLFGFQAAGGAAVTVPMIFGALLFIYSLFTDYEWGMFKLLSITYHLIIEGLLGLLLLLSPMLFGFVDKGASVWTAHVALGIILVGIVMLSKATLPVRPIKPAM